MAVAMNASTTHPLSVDTASMHASSQRQSLVIAAPCTAPDMIPPHATNDSTASHKPESKNQSSCFSNVIKKSEPTVTATICANCGTSTTPLWRRAPGGETICNACGLYLKARNKTRPPWLKRSVVKKSPSTAPPATPASKSVNGSCPGDGHCNGTGGSKSCEGCPAYNQANRQAQLSCANCRTTTTPLWRRDEAGNTICNACGLYYKLHKSHRPISMKRSVIKRRKRVVTGSMNAANAADAMVEDIGDEIAGAEGEDDEHSAGEDMRSASEEADAVDVETAEVSSGSEGNAAQELRMPRKRISGNAQIAAKRKAIHTAEHGSVPAIEDYIIPRRSAHAHTWGQPLTAGNSGHQAQQKSSLSPQLPANGSPSSSQTHMDVETAALSNPQQHSPTPAKAVHGEYPKSPLSQPAAPNTHASWSEQQRSGSNISQLLNPSSTATASNAAPHFPRLPPLASPNAIPQRQPHSSLLSGYASAPKQMEFSQLTPQDLYAHRQELQQELTHLTDLLSRTANMLSQLDHAIANQGGGVPPLHTSQHSFTGPKNALSSPNSAPMTLPSSPPPPPLSQPPFSTRLTSPSHPNSNLASILSADPNTASALDSLISLSKSGRQPPTSKPGDEDERHTQREQQSYPHPQAPIRSEIGEEGGIFRAKT
ncbi:uncharacterized protein VTP21DRAFT_7395 [Calcarisporiella thermophila]|uniref:uncharacterized protein n=1 Tax=Calcarisporiella thermophila TaxID=911321 RepID=UPI003744A152